MPLAGSEGAPLVNATRFRQAHAADWERLETIITRMEKRSIGSLSDEDLLELPALYRTTLSSLSVARDTSLDRALITYLERLSTRAYFQIYGVQTPPWQQLTGFFARGWPEAVRSL
ncbi:MAG TPA: stage II sporulation protein M, partial [Sphingomicrobium sp.]|nr:stage II sporulation protein M [Sphingomicrobium sp.]